MSEEVKEIKVDESVELSRSEKEEQLLNKAGFKTEDGTYKVDLRIPPKTEKNAVQEQSPDEVSLRDESSTSEEVQKENTEKEVKKSSAEGEKEVILEEITDEKNTTNETRVAGSDESTPAAQEQEEVQPQGQTQVELPESVGKLVDFLKDNPGATIQDYARLNADYSNVDEKTLLNEYYKQSKPHLDQEERNFLIEDNFSYDEELDDEREVKRKKLAYKEEIAKAKNFLDETKDKYYSEIKLKSGLNPEQQKAIDFFDRYNKEQSEMQTLQQKQSEHFNKVTESLFNENFKGFDFKVGDKRYRYNVKDAQSVKAAQSNVMDVLGSFLDENSMLKDSAGYHKALFAARNADALANHFYEQGKADAIRNLNAESKNINMGPRQTSSGVIETGGMKVKAVSGNDSSKLKIRFKK